MPSFDIPTGIEFRDLSEQEPGWLGHRRPLCFRHAVQRALAGHRIDVSLTSDYAGSLGYCETCADELNKEQQP